MFSVEDITKNLPSLQFDSALPDEERRVLIQLRQKNLAAISSACAQATYFVSVLNEVNKVILEKSTSSNSGCITSSFCGLKIGIIGAGRLGKQLASVLLDLGVVNAGNLFISTRCPENLEEFQGKGVHCCFDNMMLGKTVDILFLCCLPSQLNTVSKDLRGNIYGVLFSFVAGMSLARVSQLLDCQNIVKPRLIFKSNVNEVFNESSPWQFGRDMPEILSDPKCILRTCPLYFDESSLLEKDEKLCESIILTVLNECTRHGMERNVAIRLCNSTLFDLASDDLPSLNVQDVGGNDDKTTDRKYTDKLFPVFGLVEYSSKETSLGKKLCEDDKLRAAFVEKYQKVLQKIGKKNRDLRLKCVDEQD